MKGYFYNARVHIEQPKFSSGTIGAENGSEAFKEIIKMISEKFDTDKSSVEIVTLNEV